MKIVVAGGSGLIGAKLVGALRNRGHLVIPASRRTGVDIVTGRGLREALTGADVVLDVTRSPSMHPEEAQVFFTTGSRNLLEAGAELGIDHHILLSVVGARRLRGAGFLQAKVAQEDLVLASGRPHTVVAATQFFEFTEGIASASTVEGEVRLPDVADQPIAGDDVARVLADVAESAPEDGVVELAGPDRLRLPEFVATGLRAAGDHRPVVVDSAATYFGAVLSGSELLPGLGARIGDIRFLDWLARAGRAS